MTQGEAAIQPDKPTFNDSQSWTCFKRIQTRYRKLGQPAQAKKKKKVKRNQHHRNDEQQQQQQQELTELRSELQQPSDEVLLSELVDFSADSANRDERIMELSQPLSSQLSSATAASAAPSAAAPPATTNSSPSGGLDDQAQTRGSTYHGPLLGLKGFDGLVYMPQAMSSELQRQVAYLSVSSFCQQPHTTNIHLNKPKPNEVDNSSDSVTMWELWKRQNGFNQDLDTVGAGSLGEEQQPSKRSRQDGPSPKQGGTSDHHERNRCSKQQLRQRHRRNDDPNNAKPYLSFRKLSWSTMGYHYDWTARSYNEDRKSPMPFVISQLGRMFGTACMRALHSNNQAGSHRHNANEHDKSHARSTQPHSTAAPAEPTHRFTPSASIVNFYHSKSLMGGHRDDLEIAMDKPIVSLSLGCPAIFLLGGKTKDDEPVVPILIRPGDMLCMGGDVRLNYHGMAKMLPPSVIPPVLAAKETTDANDKWGRSCQLRWNDLAGLYNDSVGGAVAPCTSKEDDAALQHYLSMHRININLRQVYPDDHARQRSYFGPSS